MPAPEETTPQQPSNLESLVVFLLNRPAGERDAAIERFCRDHSDEDPRALKDAVASALQAMTAGEAESLPRANSPDPSALLEELKSLSAPTGRYRLQGEVARGGMGAILRVHDRTLSRLLAMKVILGQTADASGATPPVDARVLARFIDEAQVTGQLDHPGIVPVHELGLDATGRVYFTMRLVKGRGADEVFALARQRKDGWTLTRALEVVLKVCDTLAYAHQKGVIHRDLKPSNVMVGRFGEVYVMDWGLARVLGVPDRRDLRIQPPGSTLSRVQTDRSRQAESDSDSPIMTMDGAVVGTPSFMPPEQAAGKIDELGPRSDVYAVGAMLYVLLTGRQPYVKPGTPMSPYTILGLVLHGPPQAIPAIDASAPAELVAICEKAMAREQGARYTNMQELAEELRAFLENRVVKAHRTGAVAELRAWVRRNRGIAAAVFAGFLATGVGAVLTALYARHATRNEQRANERAVEARRAAYHGVIVAADAAIKRHEVANARRLLAAAPPEHRGWEWGHLLAATDNSLLVLPHGSPSPYSTRTGDSRCFAVWTANGDRVVSITKDGAGRVWDAKTGREIAALKSPGSVSRVAVSPDGEQFLTIMEQDGRAILVRGTSDGKQRLVLEASDRVAGVSFSPRGDRIVAALDAGPVQVWDASNGRETVVLRTTKQQAVVVSPRGDRIVTRPTNASVHEITAWDAATGRELFGLKHDSSVEVAAFSPSGDRIVTASYEDARVWDARSGSQLLVLSGHESRIDGAVFSPKEDRIVTVSSDRTARVWDAATGKQLAILRGHEGAVRFAAFSPDGEQVVTTAADDTARVWSVRTGVSLVVLRGHEAGVEDPIFNAAGDRILTVGRDGARVWDPRARAVVALRGPWKGDSLSDRAAMISARGDVLLTDEAETGSHILWDALAGRELARLQLPGQTHATSFSPRGDRIVGVHDRRVWIWDADTGRELVVLPGEDRVSCAAFDPAGDRVVTASDDGTARLWDSRTGRELVVLKGHTGPVRAAAFDARGDRVLTGSNDGTAQIWDAATGSQRLVLLHGRDARIQHAIFSPQGDRVVTAADDKTARLWDVASGHELRAFGSHEGIDDVVFSPDGERIAFARDCSVLLANARDGADLAVCEGHQDWVKTVAFSPAGDRLVTSSRDRTARVWDANTGRELLVLGGQASISIYSAAFSPQGDRVVAAAFQFAEPVLFGLLWHGTSYRERFAALQAREAEEPQARAVLDRALAAAADYGEAAAALRGEAALPAMLREHALRLLLAHAGAARKSLIARVEADLLRLAELQETARADPATRWLAAELDRIPGWLVWPSAAAARKTLETKGADPDRVERAVTLIEAVAKDVPWYARMRLGMALCGASRHRQSAAILEPLAGHELAWCDRFRLRAYVAINGWHLGRQAEARTTLEQLKSQLPEVPKWGRDFVAEAEALVAELGALMAGG